MITLVLWKHRVCEYTINSAGGVTGIFFWGGKVIFPDFLSLHEMLFPGKKIPFWYKQISVVLKSEKQKKKTNKNMVLLTNCYFYNYFLLPFQIFQFPFYNFSSFLLNFHPFFLAPFFPIRQQEFPGQKSLGALCPPAPCPPPVTPLASAFCNYEHVWEWRGKKHKNKIEPLQTNVGFFSFTDDWHWVSDAQVTEPSYQSNLDRWTHDEPTGAFSRNCVVLIRRQLGTIGLRAFECSGTKDYVCESTSCELLFMNKNKYYYNNYVVPFLPLLHLTCIIISIISTAVRSSL